MALKSMRIELDVAYDDSDCTQRALYKITEMRCLVKRRIAALIAGGEDARFGPYVRTVIVGNEWEVRDVGSPKAKVREI